MFSERNVALVVLVLLAMYGCGGGGDADELQVPSNLVATAVFPTRVELGWQGTSDDKDGFAIERCDDAATYVEIGQVPADMVIFADDTVVPDTTYSYRVYAYAGDVQSAYSRRTTISTPPAPLAPPLSPDGLTATAIAAHQVDLYWVDDSSDETWFRIERSLTAGSGYQQIGTTAAEVNVFTDTQAVAAETTYYYRVCACNDAGFSDYSNEAPVTTPPEPVTVPSACTALSATAVSANRINLQWTDNSGSETGF
ncbi:MAG TPA: hypothetical protein DCM87_05415, partial [Planctomycetes bacterium]|nr:hypothetical protein [Planctomycetota bacterium]